MNTLSVTAPLPEFGTVAECGVPADASTKAGGWNRKLTGVEVNGLAGDTEVDRPLEHRRDLVLRVMVLFPARASRVAVEGGGELRGVNGSAEDARPDLGELLLVPIDLLRATHWPCIIAYSLAIRLQYAELFLGLWR